jgi:hypothetical protein
VVPSGLDADSPRALLRRPPAHDLTAPAPLSLE